jgi:hypothetical protein
MLKNGLKKFGELLDIALLPLGVIAIFLMANLAIVVLILAAYIVLLKELVGVMLTTVKDFAPSSIQTVYAILPQLKSFLTLRKFLWIISTNAKKTCETVFKKRFKK